jgi:hypothetical protein
MKTAKIMTTVIVSASWKEMGKEEGKEAPVLSASPICGRAPIAMLSPRRTSLVKHAFRCCLLIHQHPQPLTHIKHGARPPALSPFHMDVVHTDFRVGNDGIMNLRPEILIFEFETSVLCGGGLCLLLASFLEL